MKDIHVVNKNTCNFTDDCVCIHARRLEAIGIGVKSRSCHNQPTINLTDGSTLWRDRHGVWWHNIPNNHLHPADPAKRAGFVSPRFRPIPDILTELLRGDTDEALVRVCRA